MYFKYLRKYSVKNVFKIQIQNTQMYFRYMYLKYCPSLETAAWLDVDKIHFDHDNFDENESCARDDVPLAGSVHAGVDELELWLQQDV